MNKKQFDILALGELLIDMAPHDPSVSGGQLFEANPGGAPCNVLAMAAKLGSACSFIGKVGEDTFGHALRDTVKQLGIDTRCLTTDAHTPTTLALVNLDAQGERSFTFYRKPGADLMLHKDDIDFSHIKDSRILHFGTMSLTGDPCRSATKAAVSYARSHGCLVSFDPNIRMLLWDHEKDLRSAVHYGLKHCDILKMSDEELLYYSGENEIHNAAQSLHEAYPSIHLMLITLGAEGCLVLIRNDCFHIPGCYQPSVVDTTGAGDSFLGVFLHDIACQDFRSLSLQSLARTAQRANAAASIVIGRKGALLMMPSEAEIMQALPAH